ncbi:MAG: capsid assembly protein [Ferrovibrio sp.]|uniref:capsid assembly protein n=1 Tax=Ferrovibrio sp. TaxID=1917215 RepID=UPI00391D37E1
MSDVSRVVVQSSPGGPEAPAAATPQQQQAPEQQQQQSIPEFIPEKFRNAADPVQALAEAYAALERKQSAGQSQEQQAPQQQPQEQPSAQEVREQLQAADLSFDDFQNELIRNGQLSPQSYEKLEKAGYPKDMVDTYIAGQRALADQQRSEVLSVIGQGADAESKFTDMVDWAKKNLSQADISAYNAAMDSGDTGQMKLAMQGLFARYSAANGIEPDLVGGAGAAGAGDDVYASVQELVRDMQNPLYKKDPAFRAKVDKKLARSSVF